MGYFIMPSGKVKEYEAIQKQRIRDSQEGGKQYRRLTSVPLLHTSSQNKGHYLYKIKGWEREIDCWSYPYSMMIYIEIIIDGRGRDIIPLFVFLMPTLLP